MWITPVNISGYIYLLNKWLSVNEVYGQTDWENIRTRRMVPYKWDKFMFELGDSPYRLGP